MTKSPSFSLKSSKVFLRLYNDWEVMQKFESIPQFVGFCNTGYFLSFIFLLAFNIFSTSAHTTFYHPFLTLWGGQKVLGKGPGRKGGGGRVFLKIGYWGCAAGWRRIFTAGLTKMGLPFPAFLMECLECVFAPFQESDIEFAPTLWPHSLPQLSMSSRGIKFNVCKIA